MGFSVCRFILKGMDKNNMKNLSLIRLDEVDSTNLFAMREFDNLANATLVYARRQTAGRGRMGRKWISMPDANVCCSFLIKNPAFPVICASWMGALAALDTLRECAPNLDVKLKWPNDVLCAGKKISGILCETKSGPGNKVSGIVIGVGININMDRNTIEEINPSATSLMAEVGRKYDIDEVLLLFASRIMDLYNICTDHNFRETLFERVRSEESLLGRNIEVATPDGKFFPGTAENIMPDGGLELTLENGGKKIFYSGEATVRNWKT